MARVQPNFWGFKNRRKRVRKVLTLILLCLLALVFILPFYWSVVASLSSLADVYASPPRLWPSTLSVGNYKAAMTVLPFHLFIFNSFYISLFSVTGQVLCASLAGFGFARMRFRGRDAWFVVLLATMMLPAQVTMIPHYQIFRALGWLDSFKPLIVPCFLGGAQGAFYIFLMRQFFKTIPVELEEAARIDGCSSFRIYWDIMLPLAMPAVAAVAVLGFIQHWQDLMRPLIYLSSHELFPVSLGLNMFQSMHGGRPQYMLAASNLTLIPILVAFFAAQKYFVEGITLTGLKG